MSFQNNRIEGESIGEVLLAALHPTRREILTYLSSHGRGRFTQLAEATGYDPVYQCGSFYYHLSKLEDTGMVTRERESYTLTEKGRRTNQLIGEAVSMSNMSKKEEGDLRESLKGDELVVREFSENDIPGWIEATDQAKILGKILDRKVTPGYHGSGRHKGKVVMVTGEAPRTFRQIMEQEAKGLVHGAKTRIRETYARQLTGQDIELGEEERFSFAAWSGGEMVGLVVGVTAYQKPTSIVPVPGARPSSHRGNGWRRKPHLVGHITGLWVEAGIEAGRRHIIKKLLDRTTSYLASKRASALQFVLYDDRYIEDLKGLGFLAQASYHGTYLPPELAKDQVEEGLGLPRTPYAFPVLDAAISLGLHGKTPARMGMSRILNKWTELQLGTT